MKDRSWTRQLLLFGLLASGPALASTEPPKLNCWVVSSSGDLWSFMAPLTGDSISLDLPEPESIDLRFDRPDGLHSYISLGQMKPFSYVGEIPPGSHDEGGWRFVSEAKPGAGDSEIQIDALRPFFSASSTVWISVRSETGQVGYVSLECRTGG